MWHTLMRLTTRKRLWREPYLSVNIEGVFPGQSKEKTHGTDTWIIPVAKVRENADIYSTLLFIKSIISSLHTDNVVW